MKRTAGILLVLVLCFTLGGCSLSKVNHIREVLNACSQEVDDDMPLGGPGIMDGDEVEVKIVHGFDQERMGWPVEWKGITSEETACSIATAVFNQYQQEWNNSISNYRLQLMDHDVDNNIWIASFYPDDALPGSDLVIAIDGKTGGIIGVWVGE